MTGDEDKDNTALQRWDAARREQLGNAISLIMGLATAGVGFCISRIADKDSHFSFPGMYIFLAALIFLVAAVGSGVIATCARLIDFRLTADTVRERVSEKPDQNKLKKLRECTNTLGARTWGLFWTLSTTFMIGVLLLALSIWTLNRDRLSLPREGVRLLNGEAASHYVITGKYSVDQATHMKQMAD